jgi:hypothetical protein
LTVAIPDVTDVATVMLIRAGSVTHEIDTDHRASALSSAA